MIIFKKIEEKKIPPVLYTLVVQYWLRVQESVKDSVIPKTVRVV